MVIVEKVETALWNEDSHSYRKSKLVSIINRLFYVKEKRINLTMETSKTDSGRYTHKIIENKGFDFLGEEVKKFLNALEILGQKALEGSSPKNKTKSHYETLLYKADFFGIKRLRNYLQI